MTKIDPALKSALQRLEASSHSWKDRLSKRIAELGVVFAEDYPGKNLSARSVDSFVLFLDLLPRSPDYPDVTATPAGDIYAEWRRVNGRHFTIEVLDSGEARWLVLSPNPRHPERVDRLTGSTTADALGEAIAPLARLTGVAA